MKNLYPSLDKMVNDMFRFDNLNNASWIILNRFFIGGINPWRHACNPVIQQIE